METTEKLNGHRISLSNGWSFRTMEAKYSLDEAVLLQAKGVVNGWKLVVEPEDTWVQKTYGVPSLLVRVEGVVDKDGVFWPHEVEDKPCGLGVTSKLDRDFSERLGELRRSWPDFGWVGSSTRVSDDEDWLGKSTPLAEAAASRRLFLVRARPGEEPFWVLSDRSVSTIRAEGDKSYGKKLGWWKSVSWVYEGCGEGYIDGLEIPSSRLGVVLKPTQGTRCNDIHFHLPNLPNPPSPRMSRRRLRHVGIGVLEKAVRKNGTMYCQPFHEPMQLPWLPDHFAMLRIFFGYDPRRTEYVPIGGVWNATPTLPIHGTEETVMGMIEMA